MKNAETKNSFWRTLIISWHHFAETKTDCTETCLINRFNVYVVILLKCGTCVTSTIRDKGIIQNFRTCIVLFPVDQTYNKSHSMLWFSAEESNSFEHACVKVWNCSRSMSCYTVVLWTQVSCLCTNCLMLLRGDINAFTQQIQLYRCI